MKIAKISSATVRVALTKNIDNAADVHGTGHKLTGYKVQTYRTGGLSPYLDYKDVKDDDNVDEDDPAINIDQVWLGPRGSVLVEFEDGNICHYPEHMVLKTDIKDPKDDSDE